MCYDCDVAESKQSVISRETVLRRNWKYLKVSKNERFTHFHNYSRLTHFLHSVALNKAFKYVTVQVRSISAGSLSSQMKFHCQQGIHALISIFCTLEILTRSLH